MALTPNQTTFLQSVTSGPARMPSIIAGKLMTAGLVEKTGESSGQRGYSHVRITEAGKQALTTAA